MLLGVRLREEDGTDVWVGPEEQLYQERCREIGLGVGTQPQVTMGVEILGNSHVLREDLGSPEYSE